MSAGQGGTPAPGTGGGVAERAARGGAVQLVSQLVVMGSGYVAAVVLARSLGPAAYGVYGVVYSVLLGVELMGRLGIPQAMSKLIADRGGIDHDLEASGVTLATLVSAGLFSGFWIGAPLLAKAFNIADGASLFRLAAWDIVPFGLYFAVVHILNGRREFSRGAYATMIYGVSKAAGILLLMAIGVSIEGALVVNIAGSVVVLLYAVRCVGVEPLRFSLRQARPLLELAVPIGTVAIGTQLLLSMDLWALSAFARHLDDEVRGYYVAATNVARIPNVAGFVLATVLVPSLSRALASGDIAAVRGVVLGAMRFLAILLLPGCALIAANATPTMVLLFSDRYAGSGTILVLLSLAHGVGYTTLFACCSVLIGAGHPGLAARISIGGLIAGFLLSAVGAYVQQAAGTASAAAIANLGTAAVALGVIHRRVAPLGESHMLLRVVVLAAIAFTAGLWIQGSGFGLVLEYLLEVTLVAALLAPIGLLSRADLAALLPARRTGA